MLASLPTEEVSMSVAVSCNLSDGVILGVDSAVTVPGPTGIDKVYENAEKLFRLGNRRIGVATYGLGVIGARTIGSFVREFEVHSSYSQLLQSEDRMEAIVEALRCFFMDVYSKLVIPDLVVAKGCGFDAIPLAERPAFGLVVGGFSRGAYLSEVWNITIPHNNTPGSASRKRAQREFGTNWFAMFEPIRRYILGYDPRILQEMDDFFERLRGSPISDDERNQIKAILQKHEYKIPYFAMPMEEGIAHTRFLIELVINHHRFAIGAPVVGGNVTIGKVTYKQEAFEIINR